MFVKSRSQAMLSNALAMAAAILLVAAFETARVPAAAYVTHPLLIAEVFMQVVLGVCVAGGAVLLLSAICTATEMRALSTPRRRAAVLGVGAMGTAATMCATILTHPKLASIRLLPVFFAGLGLLAGATLILSWSERPGLRRAATVAAVGSFCVSIGVAVVNPHVTAHYAALNVALLQAELLLGYVGLTVVLRRWGPKYPRLLYRAALAAIIVVLAATVAGLTLARPFARSHYLAHTVPGLTARVFAPSLAAKAPHGPVDPSWLDPTGSEAHFRRASGFPRVPPNFALNDFNVLLITAEATRFDVTSFGDPRADLTPNLRRLVERGAFWFSRAYSPSNGTFHSMAAILAAGIPATLNLETWRTSWNGRLQAQEARVAEAFSRAGYQTWWLGHNYGHGFDDRILGFRQGFQDVELIPATLASVDTDPRLVDALAVKFRQASGTKRRFFGWTFFVSPHADYIAHFEDMPANTAFDRYRQEVRYLDQQMGRVIDALRASQQLNRTILVFTADHGEEFGEHGGTHHKRTLFDETVRVPLVLWIPGVDGAQIDRPTSVAYALPWLMLSGRGPVRSMARDRIDKIFVPYMRATQDAVPVEAIGHEAMKTGLIWSDRKVVYDFCSDLVEVYDLRTDPGEQVDLALTNPDVRQRGRAEVASYSAIRAHLQRFTLAP